MQHLVVSKFVKFQIQFSLVCSHFYAFVYNSHLRRLQKSSRNYYQFNRIEKVALSQNTNFSFLFYI